MTRAMSDRKQAGFSLVELMISMVLGLMLIAGAVSIYLATKQSYREVEQVAALTENARFSEQILGDSLRHMGFFGEAPANRIDVDPALGSAPSGDCTTAPGAGAYDLSRLGYAATVGDGLLDDCVTDPYAPADGSDNDILVIKHALTQAYSDGPRIGADPNEPLHHDGEIDTPGPLQDGRTYVMTNNVGGRLFDGSLPPSITVGGQFPRGTAWEYQYEIFYIRDGAVPQLSRKYLAYDSGAMVFKTEDLAEGVERLHLLFGYDSDTDGEVDTYVDLAGIDSSKWDRVGSVEVFMLVRSATPDVQYTDNKTYELGGGVTAGPFNDNYRRLVSHTSISLRNLKLILRRDA